MSTLRAIKRLVLGETCILPVGIAAVLTAGGVIHALAPAAWRDLGGAVLAIGMVGVLLASVARATRTR